MAPHSAATATPARMSDAFERSRSALEPERVGQRHRGRARRRTRRGRRGRRPPSAVARRRRWRRWRRARRPAPRRAGTGRPAGCGTRPGRRRRRWPAGRRRRRPARRGAGGPRSRWRPGWALSPESTSTHGSRSSSSPGHWRRRQPDAARTATAATSATADDDRQPTSQRAGSRAGCRAADHRLAAASSGTAAPTSRPSASGPSSRSCGDDGREQVDDARAPAGRRCRRRATTTWPSLHRLQLGPAGAGGDARPASAPCRRCGRGRRVGVGVEDVLGGELREPAGGVGRAVGDARAGRRGRARCR